MNDIKTYDDFEDVMNNKNFRDWIITYSSRYDNICVSRDIEDDTTGSLVMDEEKIKELSLKKYELKIRLGENYYKELMELEEDAFKKIYGEDWEIKYNDSKVDRGNKMLKMLDDKKSNTVIYNNEMLKKTLSYLEDLEEHKGVDKREIFYRNREQNKLEYINNITNIVYYIILTFLILYTIYYKSYNIVGIIILIILLLLPIFIYPLIFNIIRIINHHLLGE